MNAIEAGLYTLLCADTALAAEIGDSAVYNRLAPPGTARPYVVFQHSGGGPLNVNPSDLRDHVYVVKGVADESKQAGTVAGLVLACLHNTSALSVSGYTVVDVQAETEVQVTEISQTGAPIYHCGHLYRVRLDA